MAAATSSNLPERHWRRYTWKQLFPRIERVDKPLRIRWIEFTAWLVVKEGCAQHVGSSAIELVVRNGVALVRVPHKINEGAWTQRNVAAVCEGRIVRNDKAPVLSQGNDTITCVECRVLVFHVLVEHRRAVDALPPIHTQVRTM